MKPEDIESLSFQIIDREAGTHEFSADQWTVVRRMIHTTADFEYREITRFHPDAVSAGIEAIRSGKTIVTDTNMARVGIRAREIERYGGQVKCFMNDPLVRQKAGETGGTRAEAAVDAALDDLNGSIYAVGNAPTALLRLIALLDKNKIRPALIIGLPVGFVNAAESKAALMQTDCVYISNVGRKGGSAVAASVVNALTIMAAEA